jgi:hypothetical protein
MKLPEAAQHLQAFERGDLTGRLAALEAALRGCGAESCRRLCDANGIATPLLHAALAFKTVAGQINVLIHGVGILAALPHILKSGEQTQELSLGAGNTGRPFDLETTHRVAEFKFINWRGGPEAIRQNSLFKDFFCLAEAATTKIRELYLLELDRPLRFLNGRRALSSVLSRNEALRRDFTNRYGTQFAVTCDYYNHRRELVTLIDITRLVPAFAAFRQLPAAGDPSDEPTS